MLTDTPSYYVFTRYNMRVMFVVFGIGGSAFFLCYWILYHLVIRQYEVDHSKNTEGSTGQGEDIQAGGEEDKGGINLTRRIISSRL